MRKAMEARLPRLALTLLLSAGVCLSFLQGAEIPFSPLSWALAWGGTALILEAAFLTRRTALWGAPALAGLLLLWLLGGGGISLLRDLLRAFSLQISGVPGAMPLVAGEAAVALTVLLTLLSFLCCRRGAGSAGAVLLAAGGLLVLWLADRPALMPWMLPSCAAALCVALLERHPEVSFLRVLPWAAGLALLAWALTPPAGVMIPGLKERADGFRQAMMDRLFFTEPRDVFSLSTEGYYPQGVTQLGGPVTPSDRPVMQVSAPRPVYLRGVLMNEYDGRSWRNTLGGRRYLWDGAGMTAQRARLFDQELPPGELASALTAPTEISVRMLTERESTLFVPQRIRELRAGGELVPYYSSSSEIFVTRNLQPGDTWTVSAALFQAGDPGIGTLIDAAGEAEDPQWESVLETYTALPAHLEEPVWQLAADVTAGLTSPYEKAFALQSYLSRSCRYTLQVQPQSDQMDFVTGFLFRTREGYCTYFASALTVLCRMCGLPARYAEGYLAEPNDRGEALVTGLNAHAWTEVYFRGFGWVTFDATPHRAGASGEDPAPSAPPSPAETTPPAGDETPPGEPTPSPAPEEPAPETPSPEEPSPEAPPAGDAAERRDPGFPFLPLLLLLLLALALAAALRWALTSPARREKRLAGEAERFDLWMGEVLARLAAAGMTRRPGETLMGFTRRLDAEGGAPLPLARLGECASLLRYGRVQALETDTALAREAAEALRKGLPRKARMRYAVRRMRGNAA